MGAILPSPGTLLHHGIVFGVAHNANSDVTIEQTLTDHKDANDATAQEVLTDRKICCRGPGGIDAACDRLVQEFGSEPIDEALLHRLEQLTGCQPHPFLQCGLVCAHRSLHDLLDAYEQGEGFYLYTGRGPSASMHLGHLVPFLFTAYLQRAFDVPCVIQLTDDEKYLYKGLSHDEIKEHMHSNIRDIIACGFDQARTYNFSNFEAMGHLYPHICTVQRHLTCNQVRATFGIEGSDSPGKMAFPAVQMVPAFASTFASELFRGKQLRCLVPCGIDQDLYFRLTRDVAHRMGQHKPAVIQSKFLPSFEGTHDKMSSSGHAATTVLLSDSPEVVHKKFKKAFSGARGRGTLEELRKLGVDLDADVSLRYLHCFAGVAFPEGASFGNLDEIDSAYAKGEKTCGEIKKMAAQTVSVVLERHCAARQAVSDEDVTYFLMLRQLL